MIKKVIQIEHFLVDYRDGVSSLFLNNNLDKVDFDEQIEFLIGYSTEKLIKDDYYDGEYIKLTKSGSNILIRNDPYGSFPVFIWDQDGSVLISNSINFLAMYSKKQLYLDSSRIYEYFLIGYSILSKTIYKNINCLEPKSSILLSNRMSLKKIYKESFLDSKDLNTKGTKEIVDSFKHSIFYKLKPVDNKKATLGLTGGHDSLLGGLALKLTDNKVDTVTMGDHNSEDIKIAKRRHDLMFKKLKHIELETSQLDVDELDYDEISKICGGMTTLGASSLYKMHKTLRNDHNKKYFIDCTHFEIMRKKLNKPEDFLEKYTTPNSVTESVFVENLLTNETKLDILGSINNYYKERALEKFYHFDRNVYGQNYKSLIMNELSGQRICLMHDQDFLRNIIESNNYNNSNPYWEVLKQLGNETGLNMNDEINYLVNSTKSLAFNNNHSIYMKNDYYMELLETDLALLLSNYFNINYLKDKIHNKNLDKNEDWFLLRIAALLAFSKNHKIGIT